ncbi:MAG TPA: hypothetical protein VJ746_08920 [Nitrospira sp.]|nr:hypothetical protein [Nitrospira sp.]
MMRSCLAYLTMFAGLLAACDHHRMNHIPSAARTIEITEVVKPGTVYAKTGEEIRWQNLRDNPVRVGFLSKRLLNDLGCRKGLSAFLGEVDDLVTIEPGESIGICPLRSGVLQYNVWFDPDNPKGAISPTGTIHVENGG